MREKKYWKIIYIAVVLLICLIPSLGLLVADSGESTSENRVLSSFPSVWKDGELNLNFLSEAGDYFQEHFAFRSEMVNANAELMSSALGVSADDGVIDGTDGWLYYMDSLDDYLGRNLLDDRSVFNIAHSMKLLQTYAEARGMEFLYVPVPNKNTLYGEYMPYYYQVKESEERNLDKLYVLLESEEVHYLNLLEPFSQAEETLYHRTDSHWTNQGAAYASDLIMEELGKEPLLISESEYEIREDFTGDLQEMLYPLSEEKEEEIYYDYEFSYEYVNEIDSTFDPKIQTVNEAAQGALIMYRDSFGNALLPFVAEGFGTAYFSRSVPYPMTDLDLYDADTLIVERAERFLPDTAQNPPVMPGLEVQALPEDAVLVDEAVVEAATDNPAVSVETAVAAEQTAEEKKDVKAGQVTVSEEGLYWRFDGILDSELCDTNSLIYVRINGANVYEALPVTVAEEDGSLNSYGYRLYLLKTEIEVQSVEVFVSETSAELAVTEAAEETEQAEEAEQTDETVQSGDAEQMTETAPAIDLSILEAAG